MRLLPSAQGQKDQQAYHSGGSGDVPLREIMVDSMSLALRHSFWPYGCVHWSVETEFEGFILGAKGFPTSRQCTEMSEPGVSCSSSGDCLRLDL